MSDKVQADGGLCGSKAIDFLVIKLIWLILENIGKTNMQKLK